MTDLTVPEDDLLYCQALRRPAAAAVALPGRSVTFAEYAERTTQLGHALLDRVAQQQKVVVVLLADRSDTALVTLAIQRAGCILLALDYKDPVLHLRALVDVVSASLIIADRTTEAVAGQVAEDRCATWVLDESPFDTPLRTLPPLPVFDPHWPAVMVSSSGTSGRPKAIMHSHRSMRHVAEHLVSSLKISGDDRIGAVDSFTYAGVTGTTRAALAAGAPISYYNLKERGLVGFDQWLRDFDISFMRMQTAVLRTLNEFGGNLRDTPLRTVSAAGEAIFGQDARGFRAAFPAQARFECRYSASEAYDIARRMFLPGDEIADGPIRYNDIGIGIVIAGRDGQPVAEGQTGEIVCTNETIGIGYYGEPEITAASFDIPQEGLRTFRTGDLGRIAPDGTLELFGRSDTRVKIRGVNVELVAVEDVLLTHPSLADCAVTVAERRGGGNVLVAYYVPKPGLFPSAASLRSHIEQHLPPSSVPSRFFITDVLARTGSGKINRNVLKTAAAHAMNTSTSAEGDPTPPRTAMERKLTAKVQELLGLREVGIHDDFFSIGGDSLGALELVSWIRAEIGNELGVGVVLESPTVALLAERLSEKTRRPATLSLLKAGKPGAGTVVLIAGAGDSAVAERPLAKALSGDYAVYGAQGHGIDDELAPERSIKRYARRIVKELREIDPDGPYVIGGHSFGGVVAVEVNHRLEREGLPTAGMILLDTGAPPPRRERIATFLYDRGYRPNRTKISPFGFARVIRQSAMKGWNDRRDRTNAGDDQREHARARKTHAYNVNLGAVAFWPDRTVDLPTLLVRAQRGHTAALPTTEGWQERLTGSLSVEWVEGSHSSLMYEPLVYSVGALVSQWIEMIL